MGFRQAGRRPWAPEGPKLGLIPGSMSDYGSYCDLTGTHGGP